MLDVAICNAIGIYTGLYGANPLGGLIGWLPADALGVASGPVFMCWVPGADRCGLSCLASCAVPAGMWTVRYFKSKQYNWSGISEQPSLLAMAKRSLLQFTPHSWDHFDWQIFSSPKRCVQVLW